MKMLKNFVVAACALSCHAVSGAAAAQDVTLNWVGEAPALATGVSWGVPWPQGAVPTTQAFALTGPDGKALPVQSWPLATWPDGSLKFSGFATVAQAAGAYVISAAASAAPAPAITVQQGDGYIDVNTGASRVRVGTRGTDLIRTISIDGRDVARNGRLVGLVQQGPDPEEGAMPARAAFASTIDKVTIEQSGPVRAVIKIDGKHKMAKGGRTWLPFSLRLYFYANDAAIHVGRGSMTVGYDPATGKLMPIPDPIEKQQVPVLYNLSTIQGGAQVMFELLPLLGRDDFAAAWLQYARLGEAPGEVLLRDKATGTEGADARYVEKAQGGPRLAAYAYAKTGNEAFAKVAIDNVVRWRGAAPRALAGPDVLNKTTEAPGVSTNEAAQDGLTMIETLALLGKALPANLPTP